jgi:hypothetical protein
MNRSSESFYLDSDNKLCRYFNKTVEPQLPACNYFVNWYVGRLL